MTRAQAEEAEASMTQERERAIHHWVMDTCLLFGADLVTALNVAATFIEGLRNEAARRTG